MLGGFACRPAAEESAPLDTQSAQLDLPVGFEAFYEQFHADSTYQVEHIAWPLSGGPTGTDALDESFDSWSRDAWTVHRDPRTQQGLERKLELAPNMVIEYLLDAARGQPLTERRFAKFGDEWMLIYYRAAG